MQDGEILDENRYFIVLDRLQQVLNIENIHRISLPHTAAGELGRLIKKDTDERN